MYIYIYIYINIYIYSNILICNTNGYSTKTKSIGHYTVFHGELIPAFEIVRIYLVFTAKNTVISPNLMLRKFCLKAQFPHSLRFLSTKFLHQDCI